MPKVGDLPDMGYNANDLVGAQSIAPNPADDKQSDRRNKQPACPYCGSTDTELFSLFGQQLLTVQFYCNACHTPFEHIKDDDVLNDYAARKEG
jgi:DNA-directed RNA polymerase subunit RPC12/RpoP